MFGVSKDPKDFEILGMKPGNQPEAWEDGFRLNGDKGNH